MTLESPPEPSTLPSRLMRLVEPRVLGPVFGAAVVTITAVIIHRLAADVHLDDILSAVAEIPGRTLVWALGFSVISFAAMSFYDVLAVERVAPGRVSRRFAFLAGFIGYSISNAIGFHVLVGGPVRYRLYTHAGLDAADVGRIVSVSFMTFSLGLAAVAALALVFDPSGIPFLQALSPAADRAIGIAALLLLGGLLIWLGQRTRIVRVSGWSLPLPGARNAVSQIIIGAIDIATACAALYVLLPPDIAPAFSAFLVIFIAAIVFGVASHAPGGLGVLEATVLIGLGAAGRPDVIAALLAFRLIYYALPLAVALVALAAVEVVRVRERIPNVSRRALVLTRRIVAPASAIFVFLGGCVLLVSVNTPAEGTRLDELRTILPLPFAEASHMLASLVGLALIVISRGLFRRMAMARRIAIVLLLAGALFSLAKGLDWEEASILLVMAAGLVIFHNVFYRKGDWRAFRPNPLWIGVTITAFAGLTLFGFFAFRHVEYQNALWWSFAWDEDAPRFLRATLVLGVVAAVLCLDALVNRPPLNKEKGCFPVPSDVRDILRLCPTTHPQIALLGDKRFLLSEDRKAFVMYAVSGRSWISMGDPVGDKHAARELIWRMAEAADRAGARAIFYGVGTNYMPAYVDLGLSMLKIGEVARVELTEFSLEGARRQSLRYARNRAAREGLTFEVLPKDRVKLAVPQLRRVSDAWLELKKGREKGFSLGNFNEAYLDEFDCAVLMKDSEIVAFANLWRGAEREELSIDLMRYQPGGSPVLMEAFFAFLLLYGREQGYRWFNLGGAPLSGLSDHPLASTWNKLGTLIFRRGDEFYNFEGLRAFKQKFDPVWTPQYMACPGGLNTAQSLIDVAGLISGGTFGIGKR